MRSARIIWLLLAGWLMLSCNKGADTPDQETVWEDDSSLGLAIDFPKGTLSKAAVGELPATSAENALHSLSVWVFRSDNHAYVVSRDIPESDFPAAGGIRRYSLPVTRTFAVEAPHVDVFVLANAASIGCTLNASIHDWDTVNDAVFGGDYFGLTIPVTQTVDPEKGLPMSAVGMNMAVEGEAPILKVPTLKVKRAVSRLRFLFCKTKSEGASQQDVLSIDRIVLNGHQIPLQEYVFTTQNTGIVYDQNNIQDSYIPDTYTFTGPGENIAENETPERYFYVNQDPQEYEDLINDGVTQGYLTDLGYVYLRETDKNLTGYVYYTLNGQEKFHEFTMEDAGDFARNRTWTLVGAFMSGRSIQIATSVMAWDYNEYLVNFSDQTISGAIPFVVSDQSAILTETSKDHYDVRFRPGEAAKGSLTIQSPVGGTLMIKPEGDAFAFIVEPKTALIDPATKGGRIDIEVRKNPDVQATGSSITLSFFVEVGDRLIDAESELTDRVYRFVL